MTNEEIKVLDIEALEARANEIAVEAAEADATKLDEIEAELDAIEERKAVIAQEIETRRATIAEIAKGAGEVIEKVEERAKNTMEIRDSK